MIDDEDEDPSEILFNEGKKYDWRRDKSPAAATLARANFEQAASLGHIGAIRALAHMIFDGRGGSHDKEYGILIMWSAFQTGDKAAIGEVENMLEAYADVNPPPFSSAAARTTAHNLRELRHRLGQVDEYMRALAYQKAIASSGTHA